ncbi:MAG: hypothetical protein AB1642_05435 [Pseudomonadota bacterium]
MLQWLPAAWVLPLAIACLTLAFGGAAQRSRRLLWRARWLLVSLAVFFLFFTPGEYLDGTPHWLGMTREGVALAGDRLGRLVAMLASLALLHERIGTQGLLVGLYRLLPSISWRDTTVVRLLLVLEFAEQRRALGWRQWLLPDADDKLETTQQYRMAQPAMHARDYLLIGVLSMLTVAWMAWR